MAPPVLPFSSIRPRRWRILGIGGLQVKDFPTAVFHSTGLAGDQRLKTSRGTKIDPAEALVQGFSGLKIIKPQIARTLRYRGFETNEITRAAANEFNRVAGLLMLEMQKLLLKHTYNLTKIGLEV